MPRQPPTFSSVKTRTDLPSTPPSVQSDHASNLLHSRPSRLHSSHVRPRSLPSHPRRHHRDQDASRRRAPEIRRPRQLLRRRRQPLRPALPLHLKTQHRHDDSGRGAHRRCGDVFWVAESERTKVAGNEAGVEVINIPERRVASHGARGGYSRANFEKARATLLAWLAAQSAVEAAGEPYGVYWNAPYVPFFLKRFEVHIPVRPRQP